MQQIALEKLVPSEEEDSERNNSDTEDEVERVEDIGSTRRQQTYALRSTLNLNQLVATPNKFHEISILPRNWISHYKHCCISNEWPDNIRVKYFRTILKGPAIDWYETEIEEFITARTTFARLEKLSIRYYIKFDDTRDLDEQIDKMKMTIADRPSNFIPALRKLLLIREPGMSEHRQVTKIIDKLHDRYIIALCSMPEQETVAELRDACLKIDRGIRLIHDRKKKEPIEIEKVKRSYYPINREDKPLHSDQWLTNFKEKIDKRILAAAEKNSERFNIKNQVPYHGDKLYVPVSLRQTMLTNVHK